MPDDRLDLRARAPTDLPHHRTALADDDLLLRLRLDEQVGLDHLLPELLDFDRDRMRKLVLRQAQRLLAYELADLHLDRQIGALLLRKIERPFGEQRDQLLAEVFDPVARLRTDGMKRVEVTESRSRLHLSGDMTAFEPVDLVQDDDHRNAELEHAPRDEPVARADPLAGG